MADSDISDIINMEVYEGLGDMLLPDFMNSSDELMFRLRNSEAINALATAYLFLD